ncbi:LANO_0E06810g1_1 [Lachancea nothofagi CBS 11611]|uniref:Protein STU1 n=1 Tax=Lachancea nothofagi CBS 11611 TaxID=1266666 RepID=A0A1G4JU29_9SACH|nr:LANO_0E06810g1_1 [Lachancea nothofagi CBS 11611]
MANVRMVALYDVLTDGSSSEEEKMHQLAEFKGHVKKELVHEPSIPQYFECLCETLNCNKQSNKVFLLCHSTLCYLIKRVAMQSPAAFDSKEIPKLIIPLLRTVHSGNKIWLGSVKALEAIYLAQPAELEETLETLQLQDNDRVATLLFIDELVQLHQKNNRNPLEILNKFNRLFLSILNEKESSRFQDYELIRDILAKYYTGQSMQEFARRVRNPDIKQLLDIRPTLPLDQIPVTLDQDTQPQPSKFDVQTELQNLLQNQLLTAPPAQSKNYTFLDTLRRDLENMATPFSHHKETEHNWRQRQDAIISLRGIMAGNAPLDYPDELVGSFKDYQLSDCISKAVSSLRTSLSMHACHLVKEMANRLKEKINPIADGLFQSLRNVLSATKKIASQNAFYAACVLLASMHFHSKTFQACFLLSKDKNVSPRCYAAIFLRLFLIRFHTRLDHCLVYIDEWINRSATDAQTKVRESMRTTFWYYYVAYPTNARKLLDGFQPQIRRALESSIPQNLHINYTTSQVNSSESSRRSSLGPVRTPSYAGPTQSSHIQRLSALRSSSDYHPSSVSHRNKHSGTDARKISGSTGTAPRISNGNHQGPQHSPPSSSDQNTQIDLTGEITQNHSNTLIKKYMQEPSWDQNKANKSESELDEIAHYLSSESPSENKLGVQLLQNLCLVGVPLEPQKLKPSIKLILKKAPQFLAELLRVPNFLQLISISEAIEAFGINQVSSEGLLNYFDKDDLIQGSSELLDNIFPSEEQLSLHYVKFRRQILDFIFELLTDLFRTAQRMSKSVSAPITSKLFDLYGKDFSAEKYFNCIFQIYDCDQDNFLSVLEDSPVFLKIKFGRELENRDPHFHSEILASRNATISSNLEDEKHFMELTMVNPLEASQRSSSGNSVLIHDLKIDSNENLADPKTAADSDLPDDAQGFTNFGGLSKLTEMTRVVSLYERPKDNDKDRKSPSLDVDGDYKMSIDLADVKGKASDVDLSDIFSGEQNLRKDPTVKFDDKPLIIQRPQTATSEDHSYPDDQVLESGRLATGDTVSMSREIADNDKGIIDIDHAGQAPNETVTGRSPSLSEIKSESKIDTATGAVPLLRKDDRKNVGFDILSSFADSVGLEFELTALVTASNIPYRLGNLITILNKIKNGSFTIRDLNLMIYFFIVGGREDTLREWLQESDGFEQLIEIQGILIKSIGDSPEFPQALATRCILLFSCLLIVESAITSGDKLTAHYSRNVSHTWQYIITIMSQLENFANECYILCDELRTYLISKHFLLKGNFTKLLEELDEPEKINTVKGTFMLASIRQLYCSHYASLDKSVVEDLYCCAKNYLLSNMTELRKEATELLTELQTFSIANGVPGDQFLNQLYPEEAELVKSLATDRNA